MTAAEAVRAAQPIVSEALGVLTFLRDLSREAGEARQPDLYGALVRLLEIAEDTLVDGLPCPDAEAANGNL